MLSSKYMIVIVLVLGFIAQQSMAIQASASHILVADESKARLHLTSPPSAGFVLRGS